MYKPRCPDNLHIPVVGNVLAAHAFQVRGLKLTVDQFAAPVLHHVGKINQGKLRSRWHKREHALAEETTTEGHTIEAADKMIFLVPHIDTRGIALLMKSHVGINHVFTKPCAPFLVAAVSFAASTDDIVESPIKGDMVGAVVDQCSHGVAHVDLFGEDDEADHRTEPHDLQIPPRNGHPCLSGWAVPTTKVC